MSERERAVQLANRILDRPSGDPDDDLAVLSRQLLRALEANAPTERFEQMDVFQRAWLEYTKGDKATGWEKVGFVGGFGAGWRAALEANASRPECGQADRDRRILDACEPGVIFYGPYPCETCGNLICRSARESGGVPFDYPKGIHFYPNTNWTEHVCPLPEPPEAGEEKK